MKLTIFFFGIFIFFSTAFSQIYVDNTYGLSIIPPAFEKGEDSPNLKIINFFGPNEEASFAPSLNLLIQNGFSDIEAYAQTSEAEFQRMGIKIVSKRNLTISTLPAVEWVYENFPKAEQLKFISTAILREGSIYLISGASLKKSFPRNKEIFLKSILSIKFDGTSPTSQPVKPKTSSQPIVLTGPRQYYYNKAYGFSMTPPKFPKETKPEFNLMLAHFFASPKNQMTANFSIMVQKTGLSKEEQIDSIKQQFAQMGLKTIMQNSTLTIAKSPASISVLEGVVQGQNLKFISVNIFHKNNVITLTATCPPETFNKYDRIFKSSIYSLEFHD